MTFDFSAESARCRTAQMTWAKQPLRERLALIRRWRLLIAANSHLLTEAVRLDVGRPPQEVLATDILPTADSLKYLERYAEKILRPRRIPALQRPCWLFGERETVHRRPLGVVGMIGTWNYPILLNAVPIAQALAAGNGVLWKPSELAATSAELLHRLLIEAGLPKDLLLLLPEAREAGEALLETAIDHLVFTGSVAVGRKIAARLGERLIPSTLELSGCDAIIVLHDANLEMAAAAAWYGAMLNNGQTCLACRRAFVHRSHCDGFLERLKPLAAKAAPVKLALASQAIQAERLVGDALAAGARLLGEAKPVADGACFPPIVLANANPAMMIAREVSFAPLLAVIPFDDEAALPGLVSACDFGLALSIFTTEPGRAESLGSILRVGSVIINDTIAPTAHPSLPFGGVGQSGWGVTRGAEGLLAMTQPQAVTIRKGRFRPHYRGSANPGLPDLLGGILTWNHSTTLRDRWRGLWQMIRGVRQYDENRD